MTDNAKIHAFYILLILGAIIVALVTVQWGTIPELPALIAFALTVTSLVLAVLAIIHAFVSNASGVATTTRLATAAESISHSADQVRLATSELTTHVMGLPDLISAVGARVDETRSLLSAAASTQAATTPASVATSASTESLGKQTLKRSSLSGLLLLLVAKRARDSKRAVDLNELSRMMKLGSSDYWYGFAVALAAAGLINHSGSQDSWTVSGIDEDLLADLEGRIVRSAESKAKEHPKLRKLALDAVVAIGVHFDPPRTDQPPESPAPDAQTA